MTPISLETVQRNLVDLLKTVIEQDDILRKKYAVGERFVFVRHRLQALLAELEKNQFNTAASLQNTQSEKIEINYLTVYVYLYNAQGLQLKTWVPFLTAKALYEHSVNRPIFRDQKEIENILKSKTNPAQHAYLIVSVPENDVIAPSSGCDVKSSLVRIREGALLLEKVQGFVHNQIEYVLDGVGKLAKKA